VPPLEVLDAGLGVARPDRPAPAAVRGVVHVPPVPLEEALQIARQIADAVDTAHEHGVIHRDLKPGNIKLLADFYHLAVNGDDVPSVIEKHAHDFSHIQIADDPGRGAPGTGSLPLTDWVARSTELGYSGYVGLEYKAASAAAFDWLTAEQETEQRRINS